MCKQCLKSLTFIHMKFDHTVCCCNYLTSLWRKWPFWLAKVHIMTTGSLTFGRQLYSTALYIQSSPLFHSVDSTEFITTRFNLSCIIKALNNIVLFIKPKKVIYNNLKLPYLFCSFPFVLNKLLLYLCIVFSSH